MAGIPGLGQLAPAPSVTDTQTVVLLPYWEWRFEVATEQDSVTVRLVKGTAERDGTELAKKPYKFERTKSRIYTLEGCTLDITGHCKSYVAKYPRPEDSPLNVHINLHWGLDEMRKEARDRGRGAQGPRVLICGPSNTGKTSLVRTLTGLATRMGHEPRRQASQQYGGSSAEQSSGWQPIVVNLGPREGLLSLPGTLSAAVYGAMMDVEEPAGGFGITSAPTSGPSPVPVKTPIVYYYGREKVEEDPAHWKDLTGKLASSVRAKIKEDETVRTSGVLIDAPAVEFAQGGLELLVHAVNEFAVNLVLVVGSDRMYEELEQRLAGVYTSVGEPIECVNVEKSDGVAEVVDSFTRHNREAAIKEYFFGDSKRTLSPSLQVISFDDVAIFKAPDESEAYEGQPALEPAEISAGMSSWTLTIMDASVNDPPETIRQAPVVGFIAVAEVDEDRRRLKILSPVTGRMDNKPMVWGRWPEPYINLLG
ncbi:Pre-mRNA cleavage complex II protein Clp1-domain-containing protein [Schizothecium vesticola]|uniref:Polynucleotide 5'-hydroxyl-kinase GRC3 n=1 Tax=Schizothecium vesticola TaxID=314040 RepID=A0AA40ER84_9PEZI|nr:Pre-mRNA cleavage complex II protein Clp1-domain-containing protein [Schizothecium vesticola]